jgi:hypothetical protein
MDTVSHSAWAYLATHNSKLKWFTTAGSFFPDTAMFVVAAYLFSNGKFNLFSNWLPQLFSHAYMSSFDNMMHSIPIWTGLLILTFFLKLLKIRWFIYGVYIHLVLDLFTHKKFIPEYLFPFSTIKIAGLVDYHTLWFYLINIPLMLFFYILLWIKHKRKLAKHKH